MAYDWNVKPEWGGGCEDEHPFHAVQGRADSPARVFVLGAVEVRRALICLDRNRHFDPASIIKDQGPHACNKALLHEIDERRLRAALKPFRTELLTRGGFK